MTTTTAANLPELGAASRTETKPRLITWEQFQKKYLEREDRWKYEWVRGAVEKTPRTMDQSQQHIFFNLEEFLNMLRLSNPHLGKLAAEVNTFFGEFHRRPDVSYFSEKQIPLMRHRQQIPQFVAEIVSKRDQMNLVHEKMEDYRQANIPVIWHIFPKLQQVHVYKGKNMTLCTGDDICSAEPVIPGFNIAAKDVFK